MVKKVVEEEMPEKGDIKIVTTPTNDMRSYHVNSDKMKRVLGFEPKRTIEDAVRDLCGRSGTDAAEQLDDDWYFNVRTMKKMQAHERRGQSPSSPAAPVHRQPHGRPAAGARLAVRVIDNLVGGREENLAHHKANRDFVARAARHPRARARATRCSRAPTTCFISPASATSCLRSSGRPNTCRPTCRAPCTCWKAPGPAGS